MRRAAAVSRLKPALDRLYRAYDSAPGVADPVQIARRYRAPADREVVAFCAAALAFGRVSSVLTTLDAIASAMGSAPARFVRSLDLATARRCLGDVRHRWIRGIDVVALLWVLKRMLEQSGSVEQFFLRGYDPAAPDLRDALESFSTRAMRLDWWTAYGRRVRTPGVAYFFPKPSSGSACKRLNLFLRWMVRRDAVDFGTWTEVSPRQLIVPLDTHVMRLGRCLRLTRLRSPGWRMAADITRSLQQLDADDPVRYDFALCHLGILSACGFERPQGSSRCPLRGMCHPTASTGRASRRSFAPR